MATRRRRADLDNPFWWLLGLFALAVYVLVLVAYALVLMAWLVWALIALPTAGIAKLAHHDDLATRAMDSLLWNINDRFRRKPARRRRLPRDDDRGLGPPLGHQCAHPGDHDHGPLVLEHLKRLGRGRSCHPVGLDDGDL